MAATKDGKENLRQGQAVRLAVSGVGLVGKRHVEAMTHVPGVELAAVVDPSPDAPDYAASVGVPCYTDLTEMIAAEKPDGILLATPTRLHIEQGLQCIAAGIPVLIEKPIADDPDDARRLVQQAERAGVPVLVGHHRRHNPLIRQAKAMIEAGQIGEVRAVHGTCWFYKPDDYYDTAPWRKRLGAGPVSVNVQSQRRGKNVAQLGSEVMAEGNLCLQAMGVFGKARGSIRVAPDARFEPRPRDQGIPIDKANRMPQFLQYFEGSWVDGGIPFSGSPDRKLHLWARHRCDMAQFPAEKIVAIADIPPPVVLSHFSEPPVPASSLSWSLEFLQPPNEIESDWFYLEFTLEAAAEGYTQQSGRIFTEDGVLCALSRQCMVYFGPATTK